MVVICVLGVAVTLFMAVKCDCGKPAIQPDVESAPFPNLIVNGKEAVPHSWPWQVQLQFGYPENPDSWTFGCGGSILTQKLVVTAAHCFTGAKDPKNWRVLIGAHSDSDPTDYSVSYVAAIDIHESFNEYTLHADIALISVTEPIEFGQHASNVCLPDKDLPLGTKCFTTGWGRTMYASKSDVLLQAEVFIFPTDECQLSVGSEVDETMICAFNKKERSGSCLGDSGGPLACLNNGSWELQGIDSFVRNEYACGDEPCGYARVPHFYKWIRERILAWK